MKVEIKNLGLAAIIMLMVLSGSASAGIQGENEGLSAQSVEWKTANLNQATDLKQSINNHEPMLNSNGSVSDSVGSIWQVVSGGGTVEIRSADYVMAGTIGQTGIGHTLSAAFQLNSGFWKSRGNAGGPCAIIPGDADDNTEYNILDPVYLINFLYKNGPSPEPFILLSGDPNCSCDINIIDVSYLINYLYKGGPPPCICEEWAAGCGLPFK